MTKSSGEAVYNRPMDIIYADALFLFNLLADYLLCLSAGRICGAALRRGRYLAAAVWGAAYALAVYLPGLSFLACAPLRLLSGLSMGLIAFAGEARPLRCTAVMLAVAAAFGGALWALSLAAGAPPGGAVALSVRTLLLSFALCYAALRLLFRFRAKRLEQRRCAVQAELHGRRAEFTALVDSGNSLCDPLSGRRVLVASPQALARLLPGEAALLEESDPVRLAELAHRVPALRGRLHLLPYASLGGRGLLPVFRPDSLLVDGRREDLLIGLSPLAAGDDFQALL